MNADPLPDGLAQLRFDNRFVAELPADPVDDNHRRQVSGACYSRVAPTAVSAPRLVAWASEVAELLGLEASDCTSAMFTEVFVGNRQLPDMLPYATCYGGHQFGHWAGQLGDGRAINLGEIVNADQQRWALQLKGAGPTPYSRSADGLAVLRSSLREFLCSEAMHHLGVPTTRALSLILTGEQVMRDMFYDGNAALEPGAVVCRVAPSFTRFGHFQMYAAQPESGLLQRFTDYTIATDFSGYEIPDAPDDPARADLYARWFEDVCVRTADMIVAWMRVGFVHGVMNTDNMSILGLTIDYGPYGWLEDYDPDWTPNTTDAQGRRYRFGHQPQIALWNLVQLANAIYPLVNDAAPLEAALARYGQRYESEWQAMMAGKLGLDGFDAGRDLELVESLHRLLGKVETDMTLFYRHLADVDLAAADRVEQALDETLAPAYYRPQQVNADYRAEFGAWLNAYAARVGEQGRPDGARRAQMNAVNPLYVLRNYTAQLAIDAVEQGNFDAVGDLLEVLRNPYTEQPGCAAYAARRPDWARERAGCSMLSCSS